MSVINIDRNMGQQGLCGNGGAGFVLQNKKHNTCCDEMNLLGRTCNAYSSTLNGCHI